MTSMMEIKAGLLLWAVKWLMVYQGFSLCSRGGKEMILWLLCCFSVQMERMNTFGWRCINDYWTNFIKQNKWMHYLLGCCGGWIPPMGLTFADGIKRWSSAVLLAGPVAEEKNNSNCCSLGKLLVAKGLHGCHHDLKQRQPCGGWSQGRHQETNRLIQAKKLIMIDGVNCRGP